VIRGPIGTRRTERAGWLGLERGTMTTRALHLLAARGPEVVLGFGVWTARSARPRPHILYLHCIAPQHRPIRRLLWRVSDVSTKYSRLVYDFMYCLLRKVLYIWEVTRVGQRVNKNITGDTFCATKGKTTRSSLEATIWANTIQQVFFFFFLLRQCTSTSRTSGVPWFWPAESRQTCIDTGIQRLPLDDVEKHG